MRMSKAKDLTGQVFERLTALRRIGRDKHGAALWLCQCSCDGKEIEARGSSLKDGQTRSCGCLQRELTVTRFRKHGRSCSAVYRSWQAMMNRVMHPTHQHYKNYGGANPQVQICERWQTFENFLADMGERPANTTLGRFGDVGNYEKSNCAWQARKEQGAEQKIKQQLAWLAA